MTVTKTQLADAYSTALTKKLGDEWDRKFSRRDASKLLDLATARSIEVGDFALAHGDLA